MQGNKVILVGYIGKHLATKTLENGSKRVKIRVATHYKYKDHTGAIIDNTDWHNVIAWNQTAEYAERSFVKGSKILVEGFIATQHYQDQNGILRFSTVIKAKSLMNLDR